MHHDRTLKKKELEAIERPYNNRCTSVAWLNRQTRDVAEERLYELMQHNIKSSHNLTLHVGGLPDELRMVRLGSDVLPVYTEPTWCYFWRPNDVREYCERESQKSEKKQEPSVLDAQCTQDNLLSLFRIIQK